MKAARAGKGAMLSMLTMLTMIAAAALVLCVAVPARAVTIHDLVALSQAGLSDPVLIALIQSDQTIYGVTANQVVTLKKAGVSEAVILAFLQNGRLAEPQPAAEGAPAAPVASREAPGGLQASPPSSEERGPNVTIIGDHSRDSRDNDQDVRAAPTVVVVQSIVPSFVPVVIGTNHRRRGVRRLGRRATHATQTFTGFGRFINTGFVSGSRPNIGGSITADGWRIVTPTVVPARVPHQH